ncbi:MAG: c-type cytochrome [Alphaproteobacteria bacterium]
MKRPALAVAILLAANFPTASARAGDGAEAGRKISETHCARCHVVGDFNPMGGIGSTPSFQLLAKRDDWLERFETFFERRPHPVFVRVPDVARWTKLPSHVKEFAVTPANIKDIIAFVETLRPE